MASDSLFKCFIWLKIEINVVIHLSFAFSLLMPQHLSFSTIFESFLNLKRTVSFIIKFQFNIYDYTTNGANQIQTNSGSLTLYILCNFRIFWFRSCICGVQKIICCFPHIHELHRFVVYRQQTWFHNLNNEKYYQRS